MRRALTALVASASLASACSAVLDVSDFGGRTPDALDAGASAPDAAQATDGAAPCPGTGGPRGVPITGAKTPFCIDATEVTNAQYARFVASVGPARDDRFSPLACAKNASYLPTAGWPPAVGADDMPVVNVDWCDAFSFCAWAGKRLCGQNGGGSNDPDDRDDPKKSDWFYACSRGGEIAFPYGATYEAGRCNGPEAPAHVAVAVGSLAACEGGFRGLFDMSGNVHEWEDSCEEKAGEEPRCQVRGGGFEPAKIPDSDESEPQCDLKFAIPRLATFSYVGFRCCSP